MMSTVPIYMDASLQRVLIKEMEEYQLQSGSFPGKYIVSAELPLGVTVENQLTVLDQTPKMVKDRIDRIGIPVENSKTVVSDNLLFLVHGSNAAQSSSSRVRITAMSGIEDHIDVFQGELYDESGIAEDGSYQVIVTEEAAKALGIVSGNKYLINPVNTSQESFYITVTGFFFGHYNVAGFAVFFVCGVSCVQLGYAVYDYGKSVWQGFLDFPHPLFG